MAAWSVMKASRCLLENDNNGQMLSCGLGAEKRQGSIFCCTPSSLYHFITGANIQVIRGTTTTMLYLIGLGLADETDVTVKGLELIKKAERVYLEAYTSILLVDIANL